MNKYLCSLLALALIVTFSLYPASVSADTAMRLYIPRIGMETSVGECPLVEGWHVIGDGVCHLEGTATIDDDWARVVLAGHTPGVFSELVEIVVGDDIMLWNDASVEIYRVTLITITVVGDTQWLMPTEHETLTLLTCSGNERLVVHAEKVYG